MFGKRFSSILICSLIGILLGTVYVRFKPIFFIILFSILVGMLSLEAVSQKERRFVRNIYFIALTTRVIIAFILAGMTFFNPMREDNSGALSGDEHIYWRRAQDLAKIGVNNICYNSGRPYPSDKQSDYGVNGISIISSIFYSAYGFNLLAFKIAMCLIGTLTVLLTYHLSRDLFNIPTAKVAAVLVTFCPSLIRWSAQAIKEPFIIFLILVVFLALIKIKKIKKNRSWLLFIAFATGAIFILYSLQSCVAIISVLVVLFCLLLRLFCKFHLLNRLLIGILIVIVSAVYINQKDIMKYRLKNVLFKVAYHQYLQSTTGKSGYVLYPSYFAKAKDSESGFYPHHYPPIFYQHILPPPELIGTPKAYQAELAKYKIFYGSFFISYIVGLLYVAFSPFPWSISTVLQLQAYPQVILIYFLIPFIGLGILLSIRYKFREVFPILIFYFLILSLLALTEGNIGGLFRHRDWVMPISLMFGALGLIRIFYPAHIDSLVNKKE
jgi:4-amino-4-deoxy-L-arabinose transferase-like glycosyltransferase